MSVGSDSINRDRLQRLLTKYPDVVVGIGPSGHTALHRRDQILVSAQHADRAQDVAGAAVLRREEVPAADATVLHLNPDAHTDLTELVTRLREHPDGPISASANHVLRGEPDYNGGPYGAPQPALAQPRPTTPEPDRRTVVAAVLDTGIVNHSWFDGTTWFDQVDKEQFDPATPQPDYVLESQTGHGTFVAGVLLREAPNAFLVIERVLADDGVCDELQLLQGIARLYERSNTTGERIDVINLSLGGYTLDDAPSPLVADALGKFGPDTVFVAAAGNLGAHRPFWPAALKDCVAVGALDPDGERHTTFSNRGWWVDACAVGADVIGPFVSETAADGQRFNGYARWSGTSFAAPKVAGAIAGLAARENLTAPEAAQQLLDRSRRTHLHGFGVLVP